MGKPDLSHIAENLRGLAVPVTELHADPANARTGHDVQRIAGSLKAYGQRKPLVANRAEGGKVEAGNGTLAAALKLGWTHVAVVWVDDDPATAAAFGIADNRTGELSRWDAEALGKLADVTQGLFTAFAPEEIERVLAENEVTKLAAAESASDRKLGDSRKQIKAVLYVDEIGNFEQAIKATGEKNRGVALLKICRFFLQNYGERQLDTELKSIFAA